MDKEDREMMERSLKALNKCLDHLYDLAKETNKPQAIDASHEANNKMCLLWNLVGRYK